MLRVIQVLRKAVGDVRFSRKNVTNVYGSMLLALRRAG